MRVDPEYQGRGYGRRLLEALEARARERGVDRIVLETNERLEAARALYETRGDEEIGRKSHPATGDAFVEYRTVL